ncbi:MAG: transglycosylase SLT domain-containing protein [Tannerellaceae bacterium]|nr:transglycosylase SLT domain-containing protein [Tannerellaceae bacterium]
MALEKKTLGFLLVFLFLFSCSNSQKEGTEEKQVTDLPQLKIKGEITAVTLYSSTSYFEYRGEPMGYEYDLIRGFAEAEGLTLIMKVAENPTRLFEMLDSGEADVITYPVVFENNLKQHYLYCGREELTSQVLIQRAARGDKILTDVTQLIGKEVYVQQGTRYYQRLVNLNNELGGGIDIQSIEKDSLTVEDLIEMVSQGEIPYTISDDKIARLNKTYYWNIHIHLPVSFQQRSSWVVRKDSPLLAEAVNQWSSTQQGSQAFKAITKRYFEMGKHAFDEEIPAIRNGQISPYDPFFKKYATVLGWDWQLIASLSYQESHFKTNLVSWAGAEGLMGIMPRTARALGVSPQELRDPETAIKTGVECLRRFRQAFERVQDPREKIKFTLASYNAGSGHIQDAQRLAQKYGKDPLVWENNVAEFVRLKSDPQYYNDPVCKHGYLRGSETYNYVQGIVSRYEFYKRQTP